MIGRSSQEQQIERLQKSQKAEFVAVLGRRRVGKTYLIDQSFAGMICFQMTGIQMGNKAAQLENFNRKLYLQAKTPFISAPPGDWGLAFFQLRTYLETLPKTTKQVLFLDELPWIATPKSGFLQHLAHLWNDYLSKHNHYILIICGSASSWITKNITNDKGGLHNRLTEIIQLQPFTLSEVKQFLNHKNIQLTHQEIARIYMAMGGIPYYLDDIRRGENAAQAIDRMCFTDGGRLRNEYDNLYKALFNHAADHERIIASLAGSQKGLLRKEILQISKVRDGGPFTRAMDELITCGFIKNINQFAKIKREDVYRLQDEFSIFYHRFIKNTRNQPKGQWDQKSTTQSYKIWLGYAFELLVFRHLEQIKSKLGISGVYSEVSTFYYNFGKLKGIQIDLLIDRMDQVINYCEIKYYDGNFVIDKAYLQDTLEKIIKFKEATKTGKQIFVTFITNKELKENEYSKELVDRTIVLDDLFS